MSQIVLGKVAFVDKGVYATASTYNTFDFVVTDDSCYLCVKDGNKNHPLTDTAWWKCIARGTQATEAAKTALAEANKAIEATRNAISAAGLANAKALEAGKQADLAGRASDEALAAAVEAEAKIVSKQLQLTYMELKYVKRITLGNAVAQKIAVSLFPAYVLPNVIFQQAFYSGDALYVDPRGNLTVRKTGTATIHVIPSHNTSLSQTIVIEVTAPVIRKAGSVMRFLSGSRIRKV